MKTRLLLLVSLVSLSGCANWPKDAIVIKPESKLPSPWGVFEHRAEEIRTGKAAIPAP